MSTVPTGETFYYKRVALGGIQEFPSSAQFEFPFTPTRIIVKPMKLSEQEIVSISFRKPYLHGEFDCEDDALVMDGVNQCRLWMKTNQTLANSEAELRVWAWRGGGN